MMHVGTMHVVAMVFDPSQEQPYSRARWAIIRAHIAKALGAKAKATSLRARRTDADDDLIRLGRVSFPGDANAAWVGTQLEASGFFLDMDLAYPKWSVCDRERRSPSLFLAINRDYSRGGYGSTMIAAVDMEFLKRDCVVALCAQLDPRYRGYRCRPWGDYDERFDCVSNPLSVYFPDPDVLNQQRDGWSDVWTGQIS